MDFMPLLSSLQTTHCTFTTVVTLIHLHALLKFITGNWTC